MVFKYTLILKVNEHEHVKIWAKQHDSGRSIRVQLTDGKDILQFPDVRRTTLSIERPDKIGLYTEGRVVEDYFVFPLTSAMLAVAGTIKAEINIFSAEERLTSTGFLLNVERSVQSEYSAESISKSAMYTYLPLYIDTFEDTVEYEQSGIEV